MTQEKQNAKYLWLVEKMKYRENKIKEDVDYYTAKRAECEMSASKAYYDGRIQELLTERGFIKSCLFAIDEV